MALCCLRTLIASPTLPSKASSLSRSSSSSELSICRKRSVYPNTRLSLHCTNLTESLRCSLFKGCQKRNDCAMHMIHGPTGCVKLWLTSSSMPVILPASSGCWRETRGKRRSPNICFCCSGSAAASMAVVSWLPSCPGTTAEGTGPAPVEGATCRTESSKTGRANLAEETKGIHLRLGGKFAEVRRSFWPDPCNVPDNKLPGC